MDLSEVDAVTLDAHGTLLELRDPVGALQRLLPGHEPAAVERAFRLEAEHYLARSLEGRDPASLARLRDECVAIFNAALGSELAADAFVGALEFDLLPGALTAIESLRARGIALAVVANWDIGLVERLAFLRLPVVTSAEAGAAKPDPLPFRLALERLGVSPGRAVHVGDGEADEEGARAAGMRFEWAPLGNAVARWT